MTGAAQYYALAAAAIVLAIVAYWTRPWRRAVLVAERRAAIPLLSLVATGIALCLVSALLDRPEHTFERQANPLAIAIAFDLSPSMRAIPNPDLDGELPPRFERGKAALLEFFRALEERRQPVIVSVLGFSRDAEIVMGWDQSIAQVRDILAYAVAPDLFASSGTSLEAAEKALEDAFGMLPAEVRSESRQVAIIVSDGEDTMRASSFDYARQAFAEAGFDTIALQTGLLDRSEGLPMYGTLGEFAGFRSIRGELFTVPDVATMTAIADAASGRGLYVRAETPGAVESMVAFAADGDLGTRAPDAGWLSAFGMFAVVSMLSVVIIR